MKNSTPLSCCPPFPCARSSSLATQSWLFRSVPIHQSSGDLSLLRRPSLEPFQDRPTSQGARRQSSTCLRNPFSGRKAGCGEGETRVIEQDVCGVFSSKPSTFSPHPSTVDRRPEIEEDLPEVEEEFRGACALNEGKMHG